MNRKAKMDRGIAITLIIVCAVFVLAGASYLVLNADSTSNTVSVTGESSIEVTPDLVALYLLVETEGDDYEEAKDKNAEIVDEVIVALIREGFERKDIQTTNFNVRERYDWDDRFSEDYIATHNIRLKFPTTNADNIGEAIDAAVDAGAGVSYVNFELSTEKQNEYKAQATEQAAQDAKIKAEAMASGLGKKLGKLVRVSDSSFNYHPYRVFGMEDSVMAAGEAKAQATDIQPSDQTIYSRVTVTYKIK